MSSPFDRQSPEELESQIERTRSEVDRTLEALEERFSIRARVDNARHRLVDLTTTARANPLGSAAAVAGVLAVGWMLLRGRRKSIH
jgi:hypothetical protein